MGFLKKLFLLLVVFVLAILFFSTYDPQSGVEVKSFMEGSNGTLDIEATATVDEKPGCISVVNAFSAYSNNSTNSKVASRTEIKW